MNRIHCTSSTMVLDPFIKRKSNGIIAENSTNRSRVLGSLLKALIVGDLKIAPSYEQVVPTLSRIQTAGGVDLDDVYGILFTDREGNLINTTSIYSLYSRDEVGY